MAKIVEYLKQVKSKILQGTNQNDTHNHKHNLTHNATFRDNYTTLVAILLLISLFLKDSFIKVGTDIALSEKLCASIDFILEV